MLSAAVCALADSQTSCRAAQSVVMKVPKADPGEAAARDVAARGRVAETPTPIALSCFRIRRVACPVPQRQGSGATASGGPVDLQDADAFAAVLLSVTGRRASLPVSVEVLPFLCSFADLLRHTLGDCVDVTVSVDRACPAWTVDRAALEQALLQVMLGSGCAVLGKGRLSFQASLDAQSSSRSTLLTVFNHSSLEDFSSFEWRG